VIGGGSPSSSGGQAGARARRQGGLFPCGAVLSWTCASPPPRGTWGLSGGTRISRVGWQTSASALLICTWDTRGCTMPPGLAVRAGRPLASSGGRVPSVVEGGVKALDYWQEVRKRLSAAHLALHKKVPPHSSPMTIFAIAVARRFGATALQCSAIGCQMVIPF
jgi:hypothetical protein